jgi:hypothetical protein
MNVRLDITGDGAELFVRSDLLFGALPLAENALGRVLIVPEVGIRDTRFEGFQALTILCCVKDSSARD